MKKVKKVITYDQKGIENGFMMELYKDRKKTTVYMTTVLPRAFKGYHLHRIREANYVCLKGKIKIILYENPGNICLLPRWVRREVILTPRSSLFIPINTPTGIENIGSEEGWIINYPMPAYDPSLKDEQVEYTEDELEKGIVK